MFNVTGWHEAGFGVYFSYADLEKQGKLSNDHRKQEGKWARVSEDIMWIARKYRQVRFAALRGSMCCMYVSVYVCIFMYPICLFHILLYIMYCIYESSHWG